MLALTIQPEIDRPDNNVWVVTADHPDVNNTIANAIVHGKCCRSVNGLFSQSKLFFWTNSKTSFVIQT